ncbi:3'-5' exonuclease [Falsiroseomonas oryzae]|uniref:3'-5' exonuclease n=1 Tax=Falsiroseomonas oryzae TaxID=2766473 RepID=UPI0022EA27A8|nr:3'-5' exonuclease [Roseomonas sp. MO-31]
MAGGVWQSWRSLFATVPAASPVAPAAAPLPEGPVEAQPYVVFDLETTGLRPSVADDIVQIGAVRLEGGVEAGNFNMLVNPGRPIPPVSTRYHGITDAMVARAPSAAEALGAFRDFAAGAVLVAHNAAFDLTALAGAAERQGAPRLPNPAMCSMMLARWLDPREPDVSLDGLCGRAGLVIEHRHHALGDARATAVLWMSLLARASARGVTGLPDLAFRSRMAERIAEHARHF